MVIQCHAIRHQRRGGRFELRDIPNDEPGMTPLEIWCNESQERGMIAIAPENMARFGKFVSASAE